MTKPMLRPQSRPAQSRPSFGLALVPTLLAVLSIPHAAQAFEFKSGEISGSFDTTLSVGALWRMDTRDPTLVGIANGGTARDPNSEDGNLRYDRGDLVATPFKATHDLELKYRNLGAFLRATYFYDPTIRAKDDLNPAARDRLGRDAEILDAFVRGAFDVGGRTLNLRLGKQVVSWGESTFIPNGINVLNPVNVGRLRTPGSELREGLIPTLMAHASQEITDRLAVELVLPAEWKKTKLEPVGSFFSTNDFVAEGGSNAYTGFGRRNDLNGAAGVFPLNATAQLIAPRSADRQPADSGQYGFALRYFLPDFNNTELGFYHINYHSRIPYVSGIRGGISAAATIIPGCTVLDIPTFGAVLAGTGDAVTATSSACAAAAGRAGTYFVDYPQDIKLFGLSFNTALPGGVALQGEYSYRRNQPLQLPSAELLLAAAGLGNQLTSTNPIAAAGVAYGTEIGGYRRIRMHQIQLTATQAFGPTFGAEQFVVVGEVGYTHLDLPANLKFAAPGCHLPQPGSSTTTSFGSTSSDCFATRNSWGYRLVGRLDYPNAIGAATVSPRLVFSHDVDGRGPTFNEGAKALTLGFGFNYRQSWQADIAYTAFFGGRTHSGTDLANSGTGQPLAYASGSNPLKDRDFLAISLSYSF